MRVMSKIFGQQPGIGSGVVGFWRRAAAFMIDILMLNIIISPFRNVFYENFGNISFSQLMDMGNAALPMRLYWMIFIISIIAWLYFIFFEYYVGQTPGQALTRIRVISLKEEDRRIGLWHAALRNCYTLPFFPFYIFWIVEPLYLAFYRERFLERITFTRTVYESNDTKDKGKRNPYDAYKDYKLEKV